jgi:hypothetical protein
MKRDLYAEVSTRIVAELERGAAPCVKPWSATAGQNFAECGGRGPTKTRAVARRRPCQLPERRRRGPLRAVHRNRRIGDCLDFIYRFDLAATSPGPKSGSGTGSAIA